MCGALQVCTGREPGDLPCWALRGFPCCCPHSHSGTAPAGGLLEPVTKPTAVAAPGTDGQVLPQQVGLGVGTALWMAFSSGLIAASVNYWACSFCIHAISWCVPITNLITFMSTNGLKKICRTSGTFGEVTHRKHLSSLLPPPPFPPSHYFGPLTRGRQACTHIYIGDEGSTAPQGSLPLQKLEMQNGNAVFEHREPNHSNNRRPYSIYFHGQRWTGWKFEGSFCSWKETEM